jgi:hypothetical protein
MTSIPTLINSLHILARDIKSEDGVANVAILEAAQVMQAMYNELKEGCFYAFAKCYDRHGYSLDVNWETAIRDINYRDAPLYPTSDEAVDAAIRSRLTAPILTL